MSSELTPQVAGQLELDSVQGWNRKYRHRSMHDCTLGKFRERGRRFAESPAERTPGMPLADQRRGQRTTASLQSFMTQGQLASFIPVTQKY